jgi:FixJ family two-component response regulator
VLEKPVSEAVLIAMIESARESAARPLRTQPEVSAVQVT